MPRRRMTQRKILMETVISSIGQMGGQICTLLMFAWLSTDMGRDLTIS